MQDADITQSIQEAMALYRAGRVDEAVAACRAVARSSRRPDVFAVLARMLAESGHVDEAIAALHESSTIQKSAQTLSNLGMLLLSRDRTDEAIIALREALAIDPDQLDALSNLGVALRKLGEAGEAVVVLQRAVLQRANFGSAWINLAGALIDLEQFPEAEQAARQAVALAPEDPVANYNAGVALKELGRINEAVPHLVKAISLRAGYVDALTTLGNAWHQQGKYDQAIGALYKALKTSPDDSYAQWNMTLALLLQERYAEAWPMYETRWRHIKHIIRRNFSQPQWDGSELNGRRILLHFEQGLGDTLQFIRYAPMAAARGGRVLLLCQPMIERLLQGQCEVELVTSDEGSLPPFDVHCPLLSLPLIFNTTIESIPAAQSYLTADPTLVAQWRERLGPQTGLRIGLNWAGSPTPLSNRKRTIGLAAMAPMAEIPSATFYSLQVGPSSAEALTPPAGMKLFDCSSHLTDYSETGALMSVLDVIVTCDTSVAHAAGALGVPTCVLLPHDPDWRWGLKRSDSPWYPSMTLFRQPTPGDYATPMREVAEHLNKLSNRA